MARFIISAFADEASPSLTGQIVALKNADINRVELRGVDGKSSSELTLEEAKTVFDRLTDAGIKVSAMGSPFGKISILDDFNPHLNAFRHALDVCGALGTDMMRVFSFYIPKGEDPAKYRERVFDRLDCMLDYADAAGVKLAHENEKGIFGDIGERCLELMDALGSRLGLIFDPANFIQVNDWPAEQFFKLEGFITYMHIKDALMADGSVVPCARGDADLDTIIAALSKRRGDMILSVEPHLMLFEGLEKLQGEKLKHKYVYPDASAAFAEAVGALKNTLAQIGMREVAGIWTA